MAISVLERAEKAEQMLNAEVGFEMSKAQMYSLVENDDEVFMTLAGEHGDIYDLLNSRDALQVAKVSDYIAIVTCGWAAPRDAGAGNNDDKVAPSQHPQRRRVRLLVLAGQEGMASCLRFSDTPDEVMSDDGQAVGSLADAIYDLLVEAKS